MWESKATTCTGNMKARLALLLAACLLVSCSKPPAVKNPDPHYQAGWQAGYEQGRRDERKTFCDLAKKHEAAIESALGHARLLLLRSFCG